MSSEAKPLMLDAEALRALERHASTGSVDSGVSVSADADAEEEKALESHEVIELQAFGQRKDWIADKIKLLESMPPVELFAGLDAVRASALEVPGLPSRDELRAWLAEHDKIERETEVFDSGELKKFKKITKAAAKRNLSPADTDLIEITLITIFEFDKLLHLLRGRSEQLDLLGVRLTWEEHRRAAWAERAAFQSDLARFLSTRAQWSPAVYDALPAPAPSPADRRDSVSSLSEPGFSRAARFALAESLSREAVQFSGRLAALRHGPVAGAGRALDRLIDASRAPVPDALLDEQDKLEEQAIGALEDAGKFAVDVVTLWRKADEHFVGTRKDAAAAHTLLEELESARASHPEPRLAAAMSARAADITARLSARDPSKLPRPRHALFPAQAAANTAVAEALQTELVAARDTARKAEDAAQAYERAGAAVARVETVTAEAGALADRVDAALARLAEGTQDGDGDGTPVDLGSAACLDSRAHAAYLALLPAVLRDLEELETSARDALPAGRVAVLELADITTDPDFSATASAALDRLASASAAAHKAREDAAARASALRDARRVWAAAEGVLADLIVARGDAEDALERARWRPEPAPLATPESVASPLPSPSATSSAERLTATISALDTRLSEAVLSPLPALEKVLPAALHAHISQRADALAAAVAQVRQAADTHAPLAAQAAALRLLHDDAHALAERADGVREAHAGLAARVLAAAEADEWDAGFAPLAEALDTLEFAAAELLGGMPARVPLLAREGAAQPPMHRRQNSAAEHPTLDGLPALLPFAPPPDLGRADAAARGAANALAARINGDVAAAKRAASHLALVRRARGVDAALAPIRSALDGAADAARGIRAALDSAEGAQSFSALADDAARAQKDHAPPLAAALHAVENLVAELVALSKKDADPAALGLVDARARAVEEARGEFEAWVAGVSAEHRRAVEGAERASEADRLEAEAKARREAEERRERERREEEARRVEEERVRAEEAERARVAEEERARAEQEEAARREAEERARAEEEQARLDLERQAAEERERQQRLADERAAQEERERLAREDAERLERERADKEAEMERRLQEEVGRRMQAAEVERKSFKEAERVRRAARAQLQRTASLNEADEDALLDDEEEDVFGSPTRAAPPSDEMVALSRTIHSLRERLRALGINALVRPPRNARRSSLPSKGRAALVAAQFAELSAEVSALPSAATHASVAAELRALRADVAATEELLARLLALADLRAAVQDCDGALSDLLEHIDSYPALPMGPLTASHTSSVLLAPEEQLAARITYTRGLLDTLDGAHAGVADDPRATAERARVRQTWEELEAMASDRIQGRKSRPPSAVSSGRSSRSSVDGARPAARKTAGHYSTLSVGGPSRSSGQFLSPGPAHPSGSRRSVSNREQTQSRSASRVSTLSSRSTSGPAQKPSPSPTPAARPGHSTYASRQRTTSTTSTASVTPAARPRAGTGGRRGVASPTPSDASSGSRSFNPLSRSTGARPGSMPGPSFGRAPRLSFSSSTRSPPPVARVRSRREYVADPKSKLDVAVGEVVNALPVEVAIDIEAAEDAGAGSSGWRDQSGKYWIGAEDPKLCFCRILRSQTVMVRVGGGWQELSKFIQDHFAESFRLLPEAIPHAAREEKWISSATLREAQEPALTPPRAPHTPEPTDVPLFKFQTPGTRSPRSAKSSPSPGSPLTPLQFMRRADADSAGARPGTPSKAPVSTSRPRLQSMLGGTPRSQAPVWKP